jgi:hypothetical protein
MKKATDEYQMLQSFCGKDSKYSLISIYWDSGKLKIFKVIDYTFSNGCRSPPWRQLYGELCYIVVCCHDRDNIVITASKEGYFVNKGYSLDEKGTLSHLQL